MTLRIQVPALTTQYGLAEPWPSLGIRPRAEVTSTTIFRAAPITWAQAHTPPSLPRHPTTHTQNSTDLLLQQQKRKTSPESPWTLPHSLPLHSLPPPPPSPLHFQQYKNPGSPLLRRFGINGATISWQYYLLTIPEGKPRRLLDYGGSACEPASESLRASASNSFPRERGECAKCFCILSNIFLAEREFARPRQHGSVHTWEIWLSVLSYVYGPRGEVGTN